MQRLTRSRKGDRGATAVVVAILLVVLVGVGALAVDLGAVWSDRKQLQNGADAGALAAALACAKDEVTCSANAVAAAKDYAEWNKLDANAFGVADVKIAARQVTVSATSTRQLWLAQVLGFGSALEARAATAAWGGSPSALTTVPLAFSYCQFYWQNGFYSGMPTPGTPVTMFLKSKAKDFPGTPSAFPCMSGGAHNEAAGGFGWIVQSPLGSCSVKTTTGTWVTSDDGNNVKCTSAQLRTVLGTSPGKVVLFPLFNQAEDKKFKVTGFAALKITSYCFSPAPAMGASCNGNTQQISATFVGEASLDDLTPGGGTDYGVTVVKLIK